MSRPEVLFPLFSSLTRLDGIGPKTAQALAPMGIETPRDLLFTLPYSGIDRRRRASIQGAGAGEIVTVEVEVIHHVAPRSKGRPWRVEVRDASARFHLVFFHARDAWLTSNLPVGSRRLISGKVEMFDGSPQIAHPDHIIAPEVGDRIPAFEPVYPLTSGVTLRMMTRAVQSGLTDVPDLEEWIDPSLMSREGWPGWAPALQAAHAPVGQEDLAPTAPARQRLAYDELLAHQLTLALARQARGQARGQSSSGNGNMRTKVLRSLPYRPTAAQARAMSEIDADLLLPERMNRLLQGDVGSGKTLVAFMALLTVVEAGGQGVLMAPTEILARQHLEGLAPLADSAGVRLDCLTGRDKGVDRDRKLADLAEGRTHILVGTHAVFQKDVAFRDLRLAVIDEQHRFGVRQRLELGRKGARADILVMTATPIPRSLALAQYGDMDVSVLDEKPPGRTPVKTALVSTARIEEVVTHLRTAVADGRQAYWVCPLVDESETSDLTSATERFQHLRAALGDAQVGLVHGQMPTADKDAAMADFVAGRTKVLVATTVIEVGVNVPEASIMVVERAEIFGLAQLHQLRGRVGRGAAVSTCLLMYQSPLSESGRRRLEILRDTEDGFRIAEEDLAMRSAGDVIGVAQSGLPRFRIADLERQAALMALAQSDARKLLHDDPTLEGKRGKAARVLLWLMEQDKAIQLLRVG
ncbi:ATP-dependent DNA helicase RecG [Mesobaculum littorinae]|uniref:Probable DNA 3'-5' helicase RecG n=1 Tax=Mesobaculum littorinae TaxID=2486419 RepID=A0A438ALT1_9RHOB|nr:ATP-dependent DNA helicase RecG [Mesobaculum littorinae]RVV99547.1 ATP-dependent DNA helicase RecG [Mesobaculum littorinae]